MSSVEHRRLTKLCFSSLFILPSRNAGLRKAGAHSLPSDGSEVNYSPSVSTTESVGISSVIAQSGIDVTSLHRWH
jgi:hypothetical protein